MSIVLLFFLVLAGFVLLCVLVSQAYPRLTRRSEGRAEQEMTGVGPEETPMSGGKDDTYLG